MRKYDLSVLIPARNEQFLQRTIDDVLEHRRGKTEVIVVLDGAWPEGPGIKDHPDVTLIHHAVSIGQRAAINEAARLSQAEYVMKLDAHCSMGEGFDVKLMADCEYNWTVVPRLFNLHVFDWKCSHCGNQTYQGPQPTHCNACQRDAEFTMIMVWLPRDGEHWACATCWHYFYLPLLAKKKPERCPACGASGKFQSDGRRLTDSMRFDSTLHFQYFRDFNERPGQGAPITDTMSLLGACWFLRRDRYWELGGSDEQHGSWGQQGTEIACKTWLSGGRLVCNKNTWYSHLFRTSHGFSFPYPMNIAQQDAAREHSRRLWLGNAWPQAIHPLSWLVERFWPVPGWTDDDLKHLKSGEKDLEPKEDVETIAGRKYVRSAPRTGLTVGLCYYTENRCPEPIFSAVQQQIARHLNGYQLVSVSLQPIDFGENLTLNLERGYLTMFREILAGLTALDTDLVFLCEHDVLYHPSHFQFVPPRRDIYYYNENVWALSARSGKALFRHRKSTSQLCGYRRLLIDHYSERVARVEKEGFGFRNGFEPGTRSLARGGYDNFQSHSWFSSEPNIDIRDHGSNLTRTLWSPEEFRNHRYTVGWKESDNVPGWPGITLGRFNEWLVEVANV